MTRLLWDGQRVPFTLLGGYLGAGKTTIVNRALAGAAGRRLVVLVNDVGAIEVDAALIADHDGQTLTLSNGCVCCAIADDFAQTLEQVRALPDPPDQVLMEMSGVGEPARVTPWANTAGFRLDGILVCADADQIVELAGRRFVGDTITAQLESADLILLTKTDLADDAGAAAQRFIGARSQALILDAATTDIAMIASGIGDLVPVDHPRTPGRTPPDYRVTSIDVGRPTRFALEAIVTELPRDVVRAKGIIALSDTDHVVEVQVVGRRRTLRDRPDLPPAVASPSLVVITPPRPSL